ncbi:MAG: phosphatase PAP2 family protein [Deltaproteobacteria bacterium]|nr:phosphatase PAP2 family protein [Deltaproteobacteria bacterium]
MMESQSQTASTAPRHRRRGIISLLLIGSYIVLMLAFHKKLRPDQIFLILAFVALLLWGKTGGRRFIIDWAPFTFFLIAYDGMRGLADYLAPHIQIRLPFLMEQWCFGWLTGGQPIPFLLQWWRQSLGSSWISQLCSVVSGLMYSIHFVAPFLFAWIVWYVDRDRAGFYRFAYSLTLLNVLALITFYLFPAAPPWYVWKYHFATPNLAAFNHGDPGGLIHLDALLRVPIFSSIYNDLNPNAFAAVPSLHGSYPLMIVAHAWSRWKHATAHLAMIIYVATTWFAACYLNHHYVIDLVIGATYVFMAITLYRRVLGPHCVERWIREPATIPTPSPASSC